MAIVDYERVAQISREKLLNNPAISAKNKAAVERFEKAYRVSDARKALFYKHIAKLFEKTDDLESDMHDRDKMNALFSELEKELGANYYATVISVSKTFTKWLNDDEPPVGFKDIKSVKKKTLKRGLTRDDMLSWEDGLTLAEATTSMQLKAVILTQLDGGFRPSEFIDLTYGDITIKGEMAVAHVKEGKTGSRDVPLWRCVPYLVKWLQLHPVKEKDSPLWIMENLGHSHRKDGKINLGEQYRYHALRKRVLQLGARAGVKKPLDFYNLRHSSCFLDKLDNVPLDIAAKKHGHGVEFYTETYARLDIDDDLDRIKTHYGKGEEKKRAVIENRVCPRCENVNEPTATICGRCGASLTMEQAMKREEELKGMKDQMEIMAQAIAKINEKRDLEEAIRLKREREKKNEITSS